MWTPDLTLGRLADLLDGVEVGICAFDAQDRTLAWNRTFLRFFPEHAGHVHVGEPYRENLLRFYATRLGADERAYLEEHVARGIARHQAQQQPFTFAHRGLSLSVCAQTVPGLGRLRIWRRTDAPEGAAAAIGGILTAPGNEMIAYGDAAPDGVADLDAAGCIVSANREFRRLYALPATVAGLTFEAVVARAWRQAGGAERPRFRREVRAALREALRFPGVPFEVPLPEGRWVRVMEHVRTGGARTSVHFDITALKQEQAALREAEAEAQRSATHLRAVLEHAPGGMIVLDRDGVLVEANRAFREALGRTAADLAGQPLAALVAASDAPGLAAALARVGDRDGPVEAELCFQGADGRAMWARTSTVALHAPQGTACLLMQVEDVTARREAEAALRASERRFRLIAENTNDVVVLGDLSMRRLYVSPAAEAVLGYAPEELLDTPALDFVHPEDIPLYADLRARVVRDPGGRSVACLRYRHKAGHYVWIEVSARLAHDAAEAQPIRYVASLRDVSARRESEARVRHLALHDALTDLPNRTLFRERLDQAVAEAARTSRAFAVLACDLDRFKAVNDSFGHTAGDALLRAVADRMRKVTRAADTVARLGGDEFAIVLGRLDGPISVARFAQRLIAAVSRPVMLDGHAVEVGLSIGYTIAAGRDGDADELFKRADIALYEAKAAGRGSCRAFDPRAGARIAARGQLGLDMKEAVRRGDFRLVYQPIVDAATGAVTSLEALMRWRHPGRGEIAPGTFIPLAEETGQIVPLGAFALAEACREAARWPAPLRVAVNVSVVQLRREGFEAAVREALAASGLAPDRLRLEVTESVLMGDADTVLASLHRLRAAGVRVALDDFGTGYSSLSYLRRFPFDTIKIDRAFIRDIADPDAAAIVRAVVGIGERLGMGIVAEGVETAEQLALVRREGCGEVQGYLVSHPLPPAEARAYLAQACGKAA